MYDAIKYPEQTDSLIIDQIPLACKVQKGYILPYMLSINYRVDIDLPTTEHKYGSSTEKHIIHGKKQVWENCLHREPIVEAEEHLHHGVDEILVVVILDQHADAHVVVTTVLE